MVVCVVVWQRRNMEFDSSLSDVSPPLSSKGSADSSRNRSSSGGQTALAETMATPALTKPIATPAETGGGGGVGVDSKDLATPVTIPGPAMSVISDNTQTSTETGSTEVALIQVLNIHTVQQSLKLNSFFGGGGDRIEGIVNFVADL